MPGTQIGDLPTPKPCKSGVFEKKNPKTWSLGPQTWKFPKYVSNQTRKADYFCQRLLYPIRCNLLRLLLNDLRYLVAASRRFSFFGSSDSKVSDSVWYSVSLSTSAIGRGEQEGILYAHASMWAVEVPCATERGICCELFTFSTSICRLFSGAEWRVLGATFHKHVL